MVNEALGSGIVDPFANYCGLSLFPRTSDVPLDSSKPYNPDDDLRAIHTHLRSMALQSPNKLMEQAKSILDGNLGLFNSEFLGDPVFNERNDVLAEETKDYPRERRPALGHKRACFSLKPNKMSSLNYPTEILKPTLDIDNLRDPEKFFMAYELLENAKREIQKQMGGVSFEPNQNITSTNARQRRPGLLRSNQRRPVRYKHRYSVETSDNNDHVPSSQEIFESGSLGLVGETTDKTGACLASMESEATDSSAVEGNKINDILDELLHSSCEDLEGDGAITLLQESLQIKPIILEKLSIPDLPDNRVTNLKSFGGNLSKPGKTLSNIESLLKEMHSKTPLKLREDVGTPVQQLASASPTPPKSPFAPLLSLVKRTSLSKPSVDPFPMLPSDNLSTRNTSLVNQEVNLVNSGKPAPLIKDVLAVRKASLVEDSVRKCDSSSGKSKEDNSGMPSNKMNAFLITDVIALSKTSSVEDTIRNCSSTSGKSKEDNSTELGFDTNIGSNKSHVDIDVDIGHSDMDDTVSRPNSEANCARDFEDNVHEENMQEAEASVPRDDLDINLVNPQAHQSSPHRVQANAMDECPRTSDGGDAEQWLQEKTKAAKVSVNERRKDKLHSRRKCKDKGLSRRQSLAAAGTYWESGVRRSTRIKTRPLEYWKGERLLYGRIHESLATVIGVKYMSPGSADGKATMKMKSYVSDEHKELLELASHY